MRLYENFDLNEVFIIIISLFIPISFKFYHFKIHKAKSKIFQNEAAALNHKEVVEEDRLKQMPKNFLKKRQRLEAEYEEEQRREAAVAQVKY